MVLLNVVYSGKGFTKWRRLWNKIIAKESLRNSSKKIKHASGAGLKKNLKMTHGFTHKTFE
jgi:hypothetical protein